MHGIPTSKIVNILSIKPELFTFKMQQVMRKGSKEKSNVYQLCYDGESNFRLYSSNFKCPFGASTFKNSGDNWTLACELSDKENSILKVVDGYLIWLIEKNMNDDMAIVELKKTLNLTGMSIDVIARSYSKIMKDNQKDPEKYKPRLNAKVFFERALIYQGNSSNYTKINTADENDINYAKKVIPYNGEGQGLFRLAFWTGTKGDFGVSVYVDQLRVRESQSNKTKGACLIPPYQEEESTHELFSVRALF